MINDDNYNNKGERGKCLLHLERVEEMTRVMAETYRISCTSNIKRPRTYRQGKLLAHNIICLRIMIIMISFAIVISIIDNPRSSND